MTSFLETLEQRIAPASLIGAKSVTYKDIDGDTVEVTITKGSLSLEAFTFIAGENDSEILSLLDLSSPIFAGTSISITATAGPGGDGHVNIGKILADGNDLGKVTVGGGLVSIEAGDNATPQKGVAGLTADSFGMLNPTDFGLVNYESVISGKLGSLNISGDIGADLLVGGGPKSGIGKITIGGSLIAGPDGQVAWMETTGSIGQIAIGGDIDGRLADVAYSGGFKTAGKIGKTTIGGSIYGGGFEGTGGIYSTGSLAGLSVGGFLVGGTGLNSGSVQVLHGDIGKVIVTESMLGAAGKNSASILNLDGKTASISVGGDIEGGSGVLSASIFSLRGLGSLSVGGDVKGGAGSHAGSILTGPDDIFGATIDKSAKGNIGKIHITGDLKGGGGFYSGNIRSSAGNIGQIEIDGSLLGGAGIESGTIFSSGSIGKISVAHDVKGGTVASSGNIKALTNIGSIKIEGSLLGSDRSNTGSIFVFGSGSTVGTINSIFIGGNIEGGDNPNGDTVSTGLISAGKINSVHVVGDIIAGERVNDLKFLGDSGAIRTYGSISKVTVDGSLIGNDENHVVISGQIQFAGSTTNYIMPPTNNIALGKVVIGGSVTHSLFLAGMNNSPLLETSIPFARIGSITVGGDWTASTAAAGVKAAGEKGFRDPGAEAIENAASVKNPFSFALPPGNLSRIGSVSIGGEIKLGPEGKQYGFAAGSFGAIKVGGIAQVLPAIGETTDVTEDGNVKIHRVPEYVAPPTPPPAS